MYDGGMKRKHITIDADLGKELERRWAQRMAVSGRIGFGRYCDEIIERGLGINKPEIIEAEGIPVVHAHGGGVQVGFTKDEVENGRRDRS